MKNIKTISIVLAILIFLLALASPVSALEYKTANNKPSEAYAKSEYYEKLTSISLTGDGRTDLIAVALSQLGYSEGNTDGAYGGNENGNDNYCEYNYNMGSFGVGYGGIDYPWCASFVSFCLLQSDNHDQRRIADWCRKNEGDATYIWREVSCNRWAKQLRTCGYFKDSASFGGDYIPIPGDLIYFTEDGKRESHIGIVLYSEEGMVYTVEGNTNAAKGLESNGGSVCFKSYSLDSTYIRGYGVLPYKASSSIQHIDYSGARPSAGRYISTTDKCIYLSDTASTYDHILPKNTIFEVTEIASNGRLKVLCEIDGKTVTGYVKNNSDRVIQISARDIPTSYESIVTSWGYKSSSTDSYKLGESTFNTKPDKAGIIISSDISVSGNVAFSRSIEKLGYYFDSDRTSVVWDSGAVISGTSLSLSYNIAAKTDSLSAGEHTVHFVLMLTDRTICEIDSLTFIAKSENKETPEAPRLADFNDNSITLEEKSGYEYRLEGGDWQTTPLFGGLSRNTTEPYVFYQRIAATDLSSASKESEPLTLDLGALVESTRLVSLEIKGATLSPEFEPDVISYTVRVKGDVDTLVPEAVAREGSKVTVDYVTDFATGKQTEIKITVTSPYKMSRVYTVGIVYEEETTAPADTATTDSASNDSGNGTENDESNSDTAIAIENCENSLSFSALALVGILCLGSALASKKKNNQ